MMSELAMVETSITRPMTLSYVGIFVKMPAKSVMTGISNRVMAVQKIVRLNRGGFVTKPFRLSVIFAKRAFKIMTTMVFVDLRVKRRRQIRF